MVPALTKYYGGSRDWNAAPWGEAIQFYSAIHRIEARSRGTMLPQVTEQDAGVVLENLKMRAAVPKVDRQSHRATAPADPATAARVLGNVGIKVVAS